jgi:streptogramin lyase
MGAAGSVVMNQVRTNSGERPLRASGKGEVKTPTFYRHDLGTAPARLHEPSADVEGNLWTSPLDGSLWRYHTPTGQLEILDLKALAGKEWKGLHLWPVARGREVYLCCPTLHEMWVLDKDTHQVRQYPLPSENPQAYGGFSVPEWQHIYFYPAPLVGQKSSPAVLKWDPRTHQCQYFPCPYQLSGELYMTFADRKRKELWGSTYVGNDLVRFDVAKDQWSGHWKSPLDGATPTPANELFGDTLYVSDHLNGRLVPFNVGSGKWGSPVPIPGYRDWFGYVGGGVVFRGLIYLCHSTWTGGSGSIDGEPHHFIGSWSVFDPKTHRFSRLDIPVRPGESVDAFQADYGLVVRGDLCILAVSATQPQTAVVLRSAAKGSHEPV